MLTAIVLDLAAAGLVGDRRGWGLHPSHFAERHGLIVIIALGESLIVAGSALTSGASSDVLVTGAMAVLLTCLLWWTCGAESMRAITYSRYGPPDVLQLSEVRKPVPKDDEVLVRVRAAEAWVSTNVGVPNASQLEPDRRVAEAGGGA